MLGPVALFFLRRMSTLIPLKLADILLARYHAQGACVCTPFGAVNGFFTDDKCPVASGDATKTHVCGYGGDNIGEFSFEASSY